MVDFKCPQCESCGFDYIGLDADMKPIYECLKCDTIINEKGEDITEYYYS